MVLQGPKPSPKHTLRPVGSPNSWELLPYLAWPGGEENTPHILQDTLQAPRTSLPAWTQSGQAVGHWRRQSWGCSVC